MTPQNNPPLDSQVMGHRVNIGLLIGNGGRLPAIWDGTQNPTSLAKITVVVSFKKDSPGVEWAKERGIPAFSLSWSAFRAEGKERKDLDMALAKILHDHGVELVVLAGWGLILSKEFLDEFPGRIINVHPSLLTETLEPTTRTITGSTIPVFRGNNSVELALAAGVDTTGCTVHFVTEEMDCGPIIMRREVGIRPGDDLNSLTERINAAEDEIMPEAIEKVCQDILNLPR